MNGRHVEPIDGGQNREPIEDRAALTLLCVNDPFARKPKFTDASFAVVNRSA
jgi:hypothetical protein